MGLVIDILGVYIVFGIIVGDDIVFVVCKVGVEGEDFVRLFCEMVEIGLLVKGLVVVN